MELISIFLLHINICESKRPSFYSIAGILSYILLSLIHIDMLHMYNELFSFVKAGCDHQCRYISCFVGNVGSVHDQRVFRISEVYDYIQDESKFPNDGQIIGDAAYTNH